MKRLLPLLSVCSLCSVGHLTAADIVALCIGNNEYPGEGRLDTPVNDAVLMARTLGTLAGVDSSDLSFSLNEPDAEYARKLQVLKQRLAPAGIIIVTDANRNAFYEGLARFKSIAKGSRLAFVAYSGHGLDNPLEDGAGSETYLVPIDANIQEPHHLESQAVPLSDITKILNSSGAAAKIAVLDCCRDRLTRSTPAFAASTKSLRTLDDRVRENLGAAVVPEATLYAFATSPGRRAAAFINVTDENSPFIKFTAQHLLQPGLSLREVFDLASDATEDATEKLQVPYLRDDGSSRVLRKLVLVPAKFTPSANHGTSAIRASDPLASVSKLTPFTNTLGMAFVPAGTPGVLFNVWETRVKDFEAFVEETNHDAVADSSFGSPAYTLEKTADGKGAEWSQKGGSWRDPRFPTKQSGEHSVVCVSYLDAEAFCAWLTKRDRAAGTIPPNASYRLPTDAEWSRAVGSTKFPWGDTFPPGSEDGNYSGKEAMVGVTEGFSDDLVKAGRRDSAARTATVGLFKENRFGLHDMGGNVAEWCSTWYTADLNEDAVKEAFPVLKDDKGGKTYRVLRGGSWLDYSASLLLSSGRFSDLPGFRGDGYGFRVVLVVGSGG